MEGAGGRARRYDIALGIGLVVLLHVMAWFSPIVFRISGAMFFRVYLGVTQLIYVVPAILFFKGKQRPGIVKGIIIAASLTFLLNAACVGVLMVALTQMHG